MNWSFVYGVFHAGTRSDFWFLYDEAIWSLRWVVTLFSGVSLPGTFLALLNRRFVSHPVCDTSFLGHIGEAKSLEWLGEGTPLSRGTGWRRFHVDSSQSLLVPELTSLRWETGFWVRFELSDFRPYLRDEVCDLDWLRWWEDPFRGFQILMMNRGRTKGHKIDLCSMIRNDHPNSDEI